MDEGLLKPGEVLNSTYQIEELVGEGGTGEVYRAVNTASQRPVAIKILKAQFSQDPKFIDLMRRELLHNVSDDAVVRYYDLLRTAEDQGGLYFLVMDFIDGPSVADLMNRGPVAVDTLTILTKRVAQGLAACHAASIFHRDISPDNIILRNGDPSQATLIDFGIAKDVRPDAKTVVGGGFAGKYEYAAPEQLDGVADGRSDIYSFGMTLLAAARGESPKLGTSFLEIVKAKHSEVDTSGVGEPLRAIIDSMVRADPEERPQSAGELLRMVGGQIGEPGIESLLEPEPSESPRPTTHTPHTVVPDGDDGGGGRGKLVAALIALCLVGGAGYYALGPGKEVVQGLISGTTLPEAKPYAMTITFEGDRASVTGNAPDQTAATKLAADLGRELPLSASEAKITAASGIPNDAWSTIIMAMVAELKQLERGTLKFRDDQISLAGRAKSESSKADIETSTRRIAADGGYRIALTLSAPAPKPIVPPTPPDIAEPPETRTGENGAASTNPPTAPTPIPPEPDIGDIAGVTTPPNPDQPIDRPDPPTRPRDHGNPQAPGNVTADPDPSPRLAQIPPRPGVNPRPPISSNPSVPDAVNPVSPPPPPPPPEPEEVFLSTDVVESVLEEHATCGPLTTRAASSKGFGETESIRITGDVPSDETLEELRASLQRIAEGRALDLRGIAVLNPSVCIVKDVMPPRNSGPASLLYYSAKTGTLVPGDALKPDDQAVVYFSAPEDLDGNLYVFVTDNEFHTIHLRPMQTRQENRLSKIGEVENGKRRIQLTWPLPEGSRENPVLAFSEPYGIAMMFVVVLDDTTLFPHLRAGVEDTRELVPNLADAIAEARLRGQILSHIQRFILVDED